MQRPGLLGMMTATPLRVWFVTRALPLLVAAAALAALGHWDAGIFVLIVTFVSLIVAGFRRVREGGGIRRW